MENQNKILISVTVCSYNRKDSIFNALDSIIAQDGNFDLEILVGDDGSTDGSRELLAEYQKKYPKQVKLFFHEKNLGLGGNWATLVRNSTGKYIASCDDDDYWHDKTKLQRQLDFLENNVDYGVVSTDFRTFHQKTKRYKEVKVNNGEVTNLTKAIFEGKFSILVSSVLIRKELLDKYLPYDDYIKYRFTMQDWPTWIILSTHTKFGHLPISTVTYRIGVVSITTPKNYDYLYKRFDIEKVMYKYLCDMHQGILEYDEIGYELYINHVLLKLAYNKMDYKSAKKYAGFLKSHGVNSSKTKFSSNILCFYFAALVLKLKLSI